jgi:coenzyme PQQ synthesis protein D (PqqD)
VTTLDSTVKIPSGVIFQQLDGEAVLLSTQSEVFFGLDPVGTQIWQLLENHGELRTVVGALLERYDIGQEELEKELLDFINKLQTKGLVVIK